MLTQAVSSSKSNFSQIIFNIKSGHMFSEAPEAKIKLTWAHQTCKMLINRFKNSPLNTSLSPQSFGTVSRWLLSLSLDLCFSYLAGVGTFAQTGAEHAVGDVVAVDFWPSARVMGDQSDASLLQAGVTLSLCQIKHSTVMNRWQYLT